jgi:hypothetical protein
MERAAAEERRGAGEPIRRRREPRFVILRADSKPSAVDLSSHELDLSTSPSVASRRQLRETMEEGAAELTPSITGPAVEATLLVPVEAAVEADARWRRRGRGRGGHAVEAGEGGERG